MNDIQQIEPALRIFDNMGIMCHIHALKHEGYMVLPDKCFHRREIVGRYFFV